MSSFLIVLGKNSYHNLWANYSFGISGRHIIYIMKGFGFPGRPVGPNNNSTPSYRADTSKQKSELIFVLKKSEQLWNDDKCEESKQKLS